MTLWKSVAKTKSLKPVLRKIHLALIGLLIFLIAMLLSGCKSNAYLVQNEPINCINEIKTPLDMAKCLAEYDQKYGVDNTKRNLPCSL